VVCARGVTMLSFSPMSAFISDDLPTLGRPTSATYPALVPASSMSARIYAASGARPAYRVRMQESLTERVCSVRLSLVKAGDVVLSHTVSCAVPSALRGLTTVFGMGTGVTLAAKPPTNVLEFRNV
jgi:hypothetical protein